MTAPAFSFERLAGTALASMCGDALGMPVEGRSSRAIHKKHGLLDSLTPGRLPAGSYTDDSQMMIGILECLAEDGEIYPERLSRRFLELYEPWRGYGARLDGIMSRLAKGDPWDEVATHSFGNGGAMRVGVLGAYYAHHEQLAFKNAIIQCRVTHTHPRGVAGAAAQALAVHLACVLGARKQPIPAVQWVAYLADRVEEIDRHVAQRIRDMPPLPPGRPGLARRRLSGEYACDVTAQEAVPPALGAFLASDSLEQAVVLAVSLGGDTDTIGAMTGALAGAYWGIEAIPQRWLKGLENGPKGRDHVLELCRSFF